jgi:hypothetical protein
MKGFDDIKMYGATIKKIIMVYYVKSTNYAVNPRFT